MKLNIYEKSTKKVHLGKNQPLYFFKKLAINTLGTWHHGSNLFTCGDVLKAKNQSIRVFLEETYGEIK